MNISMLFKICVQLLECVSSEYLKKKHKVWVIIQKIVHNNSFCINSVKECSRKLSKKNLVYNTCCNRGQKWFTIMYVEKGMTFLAKIFEVTDLN